LLRLRGAVGAIVIAASVTVSDGTAAARVGGEPSFRFEFGFRYKYNSNVPGQVACTTGSASGGYINACATVREGGGRSSKSEMMRH
jgi:hypothetical protein